MGKINLKILIIFGRFALNLNQIETLVRKEKILADKLFCPEQESLYLYKKNTNVIRKHKE